MASKSATFLACFLLLNLILCTMVSACGDCPKPKPKPMPKPKPTNPKHCPKNSLQIKLCANVLGLLPIGVGKSSQYCCSLIEGLVDLDAAVCLCTAVKLNALGLINLKIPIDLTVYFNQCGRKCPQALKHCA